MTVCFPSLEGDYAHVIPKGRAVSSLEGSSYHEGFSAPIVRVLLSDFVALRLYRRHTSMPGINEDNELQMGVSK